MDDQMDNREEHQIADQQTDEQQTNEQQIDNREEGSGSASGNAGGRRPQRHRTVGECEVAGDAKLSELNRLRLVVGVPQCVIINHSDFG